MEVRAKLPLGDWIWPAIWLLPQDDHWGSWPQSGEIDIMEARGNQNYDGVVHQGGSDSFGSTLHWGPYYAENGYALTHKKYKLERGELSDDYHIYGMYWDKKKLVTYIDSPSNVVLNVSMTESLWEKANQAGYGWTQKQYSKPWEGATPFDQEFNIVLNVAVGGTNGYFPDVGAKPWRNGASAANQFWNQRNKWLPSWKNDQVAMKIDYVKVWSNDDTMYTRK
jgi:beta-glucanase (GH16 family)